MISELLRSSVKRKIEEEIYKVHFAKGINSLFEILSCLRYTNQNI